MRIKRHLRRIAVALAVASIAAPVAQARIAEPEGVQAARDVPAHQGSPRPLPQARERGLDIGPGPSALTESAEPVSDGFDWGDAGVGAGIASAAFLLAAAGTTMRTRRRLAHVTS